MILIPLLTPDLPPSSFVSRISTLLSKSGDALRGHPLPRWLSPREELRDTLALAPIQPGLPFSVGTFHIRVL